MKLIVGLGNPGDKYENTRHNLGFRVVDELVEKIDSGKWKIGVENGEWKMDKKFKSEILKINDLLLVKPQTFMNESGLAVSLLATYYKLPTTDIIVIHDDVDIVLGKIKVRQGGSGGGHHGVESVILHLTDDKFIRVRLGIGPSTGSGLIKISEHHKIEKFVVESFLPDERSKVKHMIKTSVNAVGLILEQGLKEAQNQYN